MTIIDYKISQEILNFLLNILQEEKKGLTLHSKNGKTAMLNAKIAQLVEHDLAKVGVAGSSPVFRSSSGRNV